MWREAYRRRTGCRTMEEICADRFRTKLIQQAEREAKRLAREANRLASKERRRLLQKVWRENNPGRMRELKRAWKAANPEKRRLEKVAHGKGIGFRERLMRLQGGRCAICRGRLNVDVHVDHIMPRALGGSNRRSNLQLTHPACNLAKHAHHPVDHARSMGRLL